MEERQVRRTKSDRKSKQEQANELEKMKKGFVLLLNLNKPAAPFNQTNVSDQRSACCGMLIAVAFNLKTRVMLEFFLPGNLIIFPF